MNKGILICSLIMSMLFSCTSPKKFDTAGEAQTAAGWQTVLQEKLPLLGHRNWIIITDMAYPLQAKEGITTLYAEEPYAEVLGKVKQMVDAAPHVYAHVYQDKELEFLSEDICPGIDNLKKEMGKALSTAEVTSVDHEELIARLDSVSRLFEVVIIKTNLTKPYTSTFLELDCKYWDKDKQDVLGKRIAGARNVSHD